VITRTREIAAWFVSALRRQAAEWSSKRVASAT